MAAMRRVANKRGLTQLPWLTSYHTFSFGNYYDPQFMGFRSLRVINDDRVAAGAGFPMHSHANMEILTLVLEGALEHQDSLGTGSILRPGEAQLMSAGSGIRHSEFNPSETEAAHFLQIWIEPATLNAKPTYQQKPISFGKSGDWALIAAPDESVTSMKIKQNVLISMGVFSETKPIQVPNAAASWIHVITGAAKINDELFAQADSVGVESGEVSILIADAPAQILLFSFQ